MGSRKVCSVDANGYVTVDLAGTCVITVSQDGNDSNGLATVYGTVSDTITVNVAATAPSVLVNPTVKSSDKALVLTWGIPTDDGGRHLTKFEVDHQIRGGSNVVLTINSTDAFWDAATSTYTYTITGLTNGSYYAIDIFAKNESGLKGPSLG